jgi:hypothetical protein
MTGFIVSVFPFRNRVSPKEAFEGLELSEGKLSRPVLRGPGGRKAAWLLGSYRAVSRISTDKRASVDRTDQLSDGQLGSAAETALSVVPEGTATEVRSAILGNKH